MFCCRSEPYRLKLQGQVVLLLDQADLPLLQLLTLHLRLLQRLLQFAQLLLQSNQLLLRGGALQQRLDLKEELHPWPVFDRVEGPDVPLDNHQSLPGNTEGSREESVYTRFIVYRSIPILTD